VKKRNETREKVAVRGMRERGSGRSLVLAEELWRSRDVNKLVKDDSERKKRETYASEETLEDRSRSGINLDAKELTEVPDESSVGSILVDNGTEAKGRLVILYVRTKGKSRFVEERLRVGLDLSNLTLDSSSS